MAEQDLDTLCACQTATPAANALTGAAKCCTIPSHVNQYTTTLSIHPSLIPLLTQLIVNDNAVDDNSYTNTFFLSISRNEDNYKNVIAMIMILPLIPTVVFRS